MSSEIEFLDTVRNFITIECSVDDDETNIPEYVKNILRKINEMATNEISKNHPKRRRLNNNLSGSLRANNNDGNSVHRPTDSIDDILQRPIIDFKE